MRILALLLLASCTGDDPVDTDMADTDDADTDVEAAAIPPDGTWTTADEVVVDDGCKLYEGDDDAYGAPASFTITATGETTFDAFAQDWKTRAEGVEATEASGTVSCDGADGAFTCEGRIAYWDFRGDGTQAEMWTDTTWALTWDGTAIAIAMDEELDCSGGDCSGIAYWAGVEFPCTTSHTFTASGP